MIVRFAPEAEADLIETADWIAADNPQRTASFVRELRDRCFNLSDFPHAFPVVPELREEKIRRRNFRRHAILYRADDQKIEILRIVSGARDLMSLFE